MLCTTVSDVRRFRPDLIPTGRIGGCHRSTALFACFCYDGDVEPAELLRLDLSADWTEGTGTYWCHGACLQEATHPDVPIYLLSLLRDAAVYGTKGSDRGEVRANGDRSLTEREALRAARYFLEQFNEREKSVMLAMLMSWMTEGLWDHDPLETSDPAQWRDWVGSVDRVIAERSSGPRS